MKIDKDSNITNAHVELLPDNNGKYWIPKDYKVKVTADCKDGYEQNTGKDIITMSQMQTVSLNSSMIPSSENIVYLGGASTTINHTKPSKTITIPDKCKILVVMTDVVTTYSYHEYTPTSPVLTEITGHADTYGGVVNHSAHCGRVSFFNCENQTTVTLSGFELDGTGYSWIHSYGIIES